MLTKEEKIQIINSHKKGLLYTRYNLEVDKIAEESKGLPDSATVASIDNRIDEVDTQIAALDAEAARVNALTE